MLEGEVFPDAAVIKVLVGKSPRFIFWLDIPRVGTDITSDYRRHGESSESRTAARLVQDSATQ
jgi:hypothetical protein